MNICTATHPSSTAHGLQSCSTQPRRNNFKWLLTQPLAQLRQQLEYLESEYCRSGDSHAYFLSCYIVSMKRCEYLIAAIQNPDHPEHADYADLDDGLIESIARYFSLFYFSAHESVLNLEISVPNPWGIALGLNSEDRRSPLHGMLLGLIAHSCYDLPLVLSEKNPSSQYIYDRSNSKHKKTYRQISRILINALPEIADNLDSTMRRMAGGGMRSYGLSIKLVGYLLRQRYFSRLVYQVLNDVHREALLNGYRIQRGSLSIDALAEDCGRNMSELFRGSIYINIFKYIVHKLVKKQLCRSGRW